jgi:hypothetical protein
MSNSLRDSSLYLNDLEKMSQNHENNDFKHFWIVIPSNANM